MNITRFSDFTLRVLIYLGVNEGKKSTADEIATAYDISFHHVAKAAQWLAREGYVKSERGRLGGMTLNKPINDINIGKVLKATEAGTSAGLVDCMRASGEICCIAPACGLKSALADAQAAFYRELDKFSLADVMTKKSMLSALLIEEA